MPEKDALAEILEAEVANARAKANTIGVAVVKSTSLVKIEVKGIWTDTDISTKEKCEYTNKAVGDYLKNIGDFLDNLD